MHYLTAIHHPLVLEHVIWIVCSLYNNIIQKKIIIGTHSEWNLRYSTFENVKWGDNVRLKKKPRVIVLFCHYRLRKHSRGL